MSQIAAAVCMPADSLAFTAKGKLCLSSVSAQVQPTSSYRLGPHLCALLTRYEVKICTVLTLL